MSNCAFWWGRTPEFSASSSAMGSWGKLLFLSWPPFSVLQNDYLLRSFLFLMFYDFIQNNLQSIIIEEWSWLLKCHESKCILLDIIFHKWLWDEQESVMHVCGYRIHGVVIWLFSCLPPSYQPPRMYRYPTDERRSLKITNIW